MITRKYIKRNINLRTHKNRNKLKISKKYGGYAGNNNSNNSNTNKIKAITKLVIKYAKEHKITIDPIDIFKAAKGIKNANIKTTANVYSSVPPTNKNINLIAKNFINAHVNANTELQLHLINLILKNMTEKQKKGLLSSMTDEERQLFVKKIDELNNKKDTRIKKTRRSSSNNGYMEADLLALNNSTYPLIEAYQESNSEYNYPEYNYNYPEYSLANEHPKYYLANNNSTNNENEYFNIYNIARNYANNSNSESGRVYNSTSPFYGQPISYV
jgi:hypothetical protein